MTILGISTSSSICSVALLEDNNCIKEININDNKTHSENLMPLIEKLLNTTNKKLNDISLIACDNGPGSFTGLRIGIATVKALSEVLKIPVIDVSSLEGLAYNINNFNGTICSLIDARNNQVYCGIFDNNYNLIGNYLADDINNIIPILRKYSNIFFVGDGALTYKELLNINSNFNNNLLHAENIAKCGYTKFINGFSKTADSILPMYLKPSQAERMRNLNG